MKLIENYVICDVGNIFYNGRLLSLKERESLAETTTNQELLEKLSRDKDWYMRYCVARNPTVPIDTLKRLSQDKDNIVRHWAIAALNKKNNETN